MGIFGGLTIRPRLAKLAAQAAGGGNWKVEAFASDPSFGIFFVCLGNGDGSGVRLHTAEDVHRIIHAVFPVLMRDPAVNRLSVIIQTATGTWISSDDGSSFEADSAIPAGIAHLYQ